MILGPVESGYIYWMEYVLSCGTSHVVMLPTRTILGRRDLMMGNILIYGYVACYATWEIPLFLNNLV